MGQVHDPHSANSDGATTGINRTPVSRPWSWLLQPSYNGTVLAVFLMVLLCFGLTAYALVHGNDQNKSAIHTSSNAIMGLQRLAIRLNKDEYQTCEVQGRALPGGHYLAVHVGDVSLLFQDLLRGETPAQRAKIPKKELELINQMVREGRKYAAIESKQPYHRNCTKPITPKSQAVPKNLRH